MSVFQSVARNYGTYALLYRQLLQYTASRRVHRNLAGVAVLIGSYFLTPGFLGLPFVLAFGDAAYDSVLLLKSLAPAAQLLIVRSYIRATGATGRLFTLTRRIRPWLLAVVASSVAVGVRFLMAEPYNGWTSGFWTELFSSPPLVTVGLVVLLFVKPVSQELFYRRVIQGHLNHAVRPAAAVLIASVVYAAYLTFWFWPTEIATAGRLFAVLLVQGVLLGVVYQRTETVAVTVVAHLGIDVGVVTVVV